MVVWIEEIKINNEITDASRKIAQKVLGSIKLKKGNFFNCYFKVCVLDLEERATSRTEAENKTLKVSGVDQRTSITKLASSERKLQIVR